MRTPFKDYTYVPTNTSCGFRYRTTPNWGLIIVLVTMIFFWSYVGWHLWQAIAKGTFPFAEKILL